MCKYAWIIRTFFEFCFTNMYAQLCRQMLLIEKPLLSYSSVIAAHRFSQESTKHGEKCICIDDRPLPRYNKLKFTYDSQQCYVLKLQSRGSGLFERAKNERCMCEQRFGHRYSGSICDTHIYTIRILRRHTKDKQERKRTNELTKHLNIVYFAC